MYSKGRKSCVLTLVWKGKGWGVYLENIQYHNNSSFQLKL